MPVALCLGTGGWVPGAAGEFLTSSQTASSLCSHPLGGQMQRGPEQSGHSAPWSAGNCCLLFATKGQAIPTWRLNAGFHALPE